MSFDTLLRLADRFPMTLEVKGGSVTFNSRRFFITSNKDIALWYPKFSADRLVALSKRVHVNRTSKKVGEEIHVVTEYFDVESPGNPLKRRVDDILDFSILKQPCVDESAEASAHFVPTLEGSVEQVTAPEQSEGNWFINCSYIILQN